MILTKKKKGYILLISNILILTVLVNIFISNYNYYPLNSKIVISLFIWLELFLIKVSYNMIKSK